MSVQTALDSDLREQTLLSIIRTLPAERVNQILAYARYVQIQTLDDFALAEEESDEEIAADEAHWDEQFAATQEGLEKMADNVRAEILAGKSRPMLFTKDGKIIPG